MDVTTRAQIVSAEVARSISQMEDEFGAELARRAALSPDFRSFGSLWISPVARHPAYGPAPAGRAFCKVTNTYRTDADIDYERWTTTDWPSRVDAFADAVRDAVGRIAKTKVTDEERALLLEAVEQARRAVRSAPPRRVAPVSPVYLTVDERGRATSVSSISPGPRQGVVTVAPENAGSVAGALKWMSPAPGMFKLYRKDGEQLLYREAWPTERAVVEHWGACGERGETRDHPFRTRPRRSACSAG